MRKPNTVPFNLIFQMQPPSRKKEAIVSEHVLEELDEAGYTAYWNHKKGVMELELPIEDTHFPRLGKREWWKNHNHLTDKALQTQLTPHMHELFQTVLIAQKSTLERYLRQWTLVQIFAHATSQNTRVPEEARKLWAYDINLKL